MPKIIIGTLLLFSLLLLAETGKKPPVDEGDKLTHKEDTIKGSKDVNNTFESKKQSLAKLKKYLYIRRKNISHPPFKCLLIDGKSNKIKTLFVEKSSVNSINFKVDKSMLKVDDAVVVINSKDSKENPTGKEAIVQVSIVN